ncbi:MAG: MoaD family protein [Bacillota bacterium]
MKVKFFSFLRLITGVSTLEMNAPNVNSLLNILIERYGIPFEKEVFTDSRGLREGMVILVNGRNILFLEGLGTKLKEDDTVCLIPPAGGG